MAVDGEEAFERLVVSRAPALLRLALMLTGDLHDAEDLLQSTLLNAHRHADRIVAMEAPAAYLRQTMVNEHLTGHRTRSRRPRTVSFETAEGGYAAATAASVTRDADVLSQREEAWALLAALPPRQRTVLVLRFYEDLPDARIAEVLDCSEGTVRSNASRGLAALRRHLAPEEGVIPWMS